jgi:hypothetical protein
VVFDTLSRYLPRNDTKDDCINRWCFAAVVDNRRDRVLYVYSMLRAFHFLEMFLGRSHLVLCDIRNHQHKNERRWLRLDIWEGTAAVTNRVAGKASLRTCTLVLEWNPPIVLFITGPTVISSEHGDAHQYTRPARGWSGRGAFVFRETQTQPPPYPHTSSTSLLQ